MVFPQTILERVVQAFIGGAWVDVTSFVYHRDPITITRGAGAERSQTQPARCTLTLDNRDGRWSPRNPAGAWFGQLARNTLLAVSVRLGERYLLLGGAAANYITAPDSAGTSVTGDIDVRMDVTLQRWRGLRTDLAGKYGAAGQRSWAVELLDTGKVRWTWSSDGTAITQVTSTIGVPWPMGNRSGLRVTFDVNNGAGGSTATFYYSPDQGVTGTWTQLGAPVVTAGVTSIFDSTTSTSFGAVNSGSTGLQEGRLHAAEVRNGIGGSVVAGPNLRTQTRGAASFSDGTNTWTVGGAGASISDFRTEFVGEIPEFPVDRDVSGKDVYVTATATGITRRLGQGQSPVQSTLRRGTPSVLGTALRAYWPLEEGSRAEQGVSALASAPPMRWGSPAPALAAYEGFDGSAPIPTMNGASLRGTVKTYTSTGIVQVRALVAIPAAGAANGAVLLRITTGGTAARWDFIYGTGGTLQLRAFDSDGTDVGGSAAVGFSMDGRPVMVQVDLAQNGGNVDYDFSTVEPGKSTGGTFGGSVAGRTVTTARAIALNPGGLLTDTAIGQVSVASAITSLFALGRPLAGYAQETAGRRVERLCSEQGITFLPFGDLDDSVVMGPQPRDTLLNVLRECESTDGGILFEPRDRRGIAYKPRTALYTPGAEVTLAGGGGAGGDLFDIRSTDDDQLTRNDVTAQRPNGASARVEADTSSPLAVAAVGRYDEAVTVNVYADSQLEDQASWRMQSGTVDEPRFPGIVVHLSRAALVAAPGKTTACIDADLGDGATIANPGTALPRTDIRQQIVSRTVVLSSHEYVVTWVGQPAAVYDVATYEIDPASEESRYSSEGSTVNGGFSSSASPISVATPVGSVWGHGDGDFTIVVPQTGERMRVTAVAGTATPQSFTVTRGVDGTTAKALTGGESVELARPVRWGL